MNLEERQSTFKPKKVESNTNDTSDLYKYLTIYEGDTDGLEKMRVKDEVAKAGWNKHLIMPLELDEVVYVHPDQSDVPNQYIKVIHSEKKCVSTFGKSEFDKLG